MEHAVPNIMRRPQVFYFSLLKLILTSLFLGCGVMFMIFIAMASFNRLPFLSALASLSVLLVSYPLALSIFRLLHSSHPAITLDSASVGFKANFRTENVLFSDIKSVELIRPNSDQVGKTLYIQLNSELRGGQRRWRAKSIPLALIAVNNAELLEEIRFRVAGIEGRFNI
jgi:hypothetical protein